jgi:hypothetical protein
MPHWMVHIPMYCVLSHRSSLCTSRISPTRHITRRPHHGVQVDAKHDVFCLQCTCGVCQQIASHAFGVSIQFVCLLSCYNVGINDIEMTDSSIESSAMERMCTSTCLRRKSSSSNDVYSDEANITVYLADGESRAVHDVLLSLSSPVFRNILQQAFNECLSQELLFVNMNASDWDTFYGFIDCRNGVNRTAIINLDNIQMLTRAFQLYEMQSLLQVRKHCTSSVA